MDQNNQSTTPPSEASPNQTNIAPKVMNFNVEKPKGFDFFHKKAFLFGLLSVVFLGAIGILVGYFYIQQRVTTTPKATDCFSFQVTEEKEHGGRGPKASIHGTFKNDCATPMTVYGYKYWCLTSADRGICGDNESKDSVDVGPGEGKDIIFEQPVGNTGSCGSAQVDVTIDKNFSRGPNRQGNALVGTSAFLDACQQEQTAVCDSLTVSPANGTPPLSVTANLTGHATGGTITKYNFDWGDGSAADSGAQAQKTHTFATAGTFTIQGTVVDDKNNTAGGAACQKTVTTTTQTVYKYQICQNNACGTPQNCPTAGVDCRPTLNKCTTNADCQSVTTFHYQVCENNACSAPKDCPTPGVDCKATLNKCTVDTDCQSVTTFHYQVCENNACSAPKNCPTPGVDCSGQLNKCTQDSDCTHVQTFQHNVCINQSCVKVDCSPSNQSCSGECTNDDGCKTTTNATHKQCNNNSCTVVSGAGQDQCTSDAMCRPAATPPPIPVSGNPMLTIGGIAVGLGAVFLGLLFAL